MNLSHVEKFFAQLGRALKTPTIIVLTGGVAASLMADPRTTDDIDFALLATPWEQTAALLEKIAAKHGIVLQYSQDIDRWSSVTFLDWKKHTKPYKKAGKLDLRILEPLYWSIGKITRGTDRDIADLESVLKAQKVPWDKLLALWAKALKKSPPSTSLFNAKKQMEGFVKGSGKKIWGPSFNAGAALELFLKKLQSKN